LAQPGDLSLEGLDAVGLLGDEDIGVEQLADEFGQEFLAAVGAVSPASINSARLPAVGGTRPR
jgi:hypothetical protein